MKKQFIKKFFWIFLLFGLLLTLVNAQFYADISIDVNSAGDVSINGKTNFNNFLNITNSAQFTSKKGDIWTLNVSSNKNEVFEDFIYELILPPNSQIYYMKTTPNFRIEDSNNRIKIIGLGSDKPFTILLQYKINSKNNLSKVNVFYLLLSLGFSIFVGLIVYFGFKLLNKETNIEKEIEGVIEDSELINPEHKLKIKKYEINSFSDRQKRIIELLQDKKSGLTQDELGDVLKIPKSSMSRNIKSLEIKKIVKIVEYGRYNKIILNEKKLE